MPTSVHTQTGADKSEKMPPGASKANAATERPPKLRAWSVSCSSKVGRTAAESARTCLMRPRRGPPVSARRRPSHVPKVTGCDARPPNCKSDSRQRTSPSTWPYTSRVGGRPDSRLCVADCSAIARYGEPVSTVARCTTPPRTKSAASTPPAAGCRGTVHDTARGAASGATSNVGSSDGAKKDPRTSHRRARGSVSITRMRGTACRERFAANQ